MNADSTAFRNPAADLIAQNIRARAFDALKSSKAERPSPTYDEPLSRIVPTTLAESLQNDFGNQVLSIRKSLLYYLIAFMTVETFLLFAIIVAASCNLLKIQDRTLQILVGATIGQVSAMLIVIVRSVYSDSLNQIIMRDTRRSQRR